MTSIRDNPTTSSQDHNNNQSRNAPVEFIYLPQDTTINKPDSNSPKLHVPLKDWWLDEHIDNKNSDIRYISGKEDTLAAEKPKKVTLVGWREVLEKSNNSTETELLKLTKSILKSDQTPVFVFVIITWIGTKLGGGVLWAVLVLSIALTYHRNKTMRFKRNLKDDLIRQYLNNKLEDSEESCDWLNDFLKRFWIIYEPVLSNTISSIVNEVLEVSTPSFLDSLKLSTFTLGTKSPRVDNIRTYKNEENLEQIMMDWKVEFVPNDLTNLTSIEVSQKINPKIQLQVRVGKGMVGAEMPVLVEDISLKGTMRIIINLTDEMPFISTASMMFTKQPVIDFVLKPIGGQTLGFDVASIPGLSKYIKDQIHGILNPMMYNPNKFVLNINEILNAMPLNIIVGLLRINVKRARNLKFSDMLNTPDPYVKFSLPYRENIYKTTHKSNTLNPTWNETIYIILYNISDILKIDIFDYSQFKKDKTISQTQFELIQFEKNKEFIDVSLQTKNNNIKNGILNLDLSFYPVSAPPLVQNNKNQVEGEKITDDNNNIETSKSNFGIVRLFIHQIKEIDTSKSMIKKYSLYVTVLLNGKEIFTTRKKKRTNTPIFEEYCEFIISDISNDKDTIELKILDDRGIQVDPIIANYSEKVKDLIKREPNSFVDLKNISKGKLKISAYWYPIEIDNSNIELNLNGLVNTNSLGFDTPSIGIIKLNLVEANDLKNKEKFKGGSSDPYIIIRKNGKNIHTTKSVKNNVNPMFNEIVFVCVCSINDLLQLEVFDENSISTDKSLGQTEISANTLITAKYDKNEKVYYEQCIPLFETVANLRFPNNQKKGTLSYTASFYPANLSFDDDDNENPTNNPENNLIKGGIVTIKIFELENFNNISTSEIVITKNNNTLNPLLTNKIENNILLNSDINTCQGVMCLKPDFVSVIVKEKNTKNLIKIEFIEIIKNKNKNTWYDIPNTNKRIMLGLKFQNIIDDQIAFKDIDTKNVNGNLYVNILEASNLVSADSSGLSDPYIVVRLNNRKIHKTKVVKKCLNPTFNENFIVPIINLSSYILKIEVFDWNKLQSKVSLGDFEIELKELEIEKELTRSYDLKNIEKGKVKIRTLFRLDDLDDNEIKKATSLSNISQTFFNSTYSNKMKNNQSSLFNLNSTNTNINTNNSISESTGLPGNLKITIYEAHNLKAVDSSGTSDPYIKISQKNKILYKTKHIKKNCSPVWNETFEISTDGSSLILKMEIFDYNKIHNDTIIAFKEFNVWDFINPSINNKDADFWVKNLIGDEEGQVHLMIEFNNK